MAATVNKRSLRTFRRAIRIPSTLESAAAVCVMMTCATGAQAIDWRFEPSVGAYATYTDNVNQRQTNQQSAFILGVTPGFSLRSKGSRRLQLSLQYGLNASERFSNGTSNDLYHNLNGVLQAELVEDFLYLDSSVNISQQLISLLGSTADRSVNNSNSTTVGTYTFSPYIKKRFDTFADLQARYTASGAVFQNNVSANSSSNALTATLTSGTRFDDINWGLDYSLRKAVNTGGPNTLYDTTTTFENVTAQLGYAVTRKIRVFGTVGHDWNDYVASPGTVTSGPSYSVGFNWAPSRLTSLEASVGHRYFGPTMSLAGSHRTRQTRWTVRYSEDISDFTQQTTQASNQLFFVCQAFPYVQPATELAQTPPPNCIGPYPAAQLSSVFSSLGFTQSDLVALGLQNIAIANGVFINKNFTAGVTWDIRRLSFGLSAQDTRRLYQALSNAEDHIQGVTGSVSYRVSPQITTTGSVSLTRSSLDPLLGGGSTDDRSFSLGLNRQFVKQLNGSLVFRHTDRTSNLANLSYVENNLTASILMRF